MCRILTTNSRNRKHMWRFHGESGKMFWKIEILTYLAFIFLPLYCVTFTVFQSYARIHVWKPYPMFVPFLWNEFVSSILAESDCLSETKHPFAKRQERNHGARIIASLLCQSWICHSTNDKNSQLNVRFFNSWNNKL